MKVEVYCGHYRNYEEWLNDSGECSYSDTIEVDDVGWEEGSVSMKCPSCNNTLWQENDHYTEIEDVK